MDEFGKDIVQYFEDNFQDSTALEDFFETVNSLFLPDKVVFLNSYILKNKHDYKLLNYTIRFINKKKLYGNLQDLINFISIATNDSHFMDLKVIAIKTLSEFKDKSAVQILLFCLNDINSNYKIRLAAADALGKIGDKSAFESLSKIASDEKEKSVYVRESAAAALGMLGDNRALDIFNSIINTKQMFLDKFSYLKERIIEAMSRLDIEKSAKAYDILKASLMDPSESVRIASIETIMNSNMLDSYELIYDRLKFDDSIEVKKNALVALYNISDANILHEVINGDYCNELKDYAKEIIEEYENEE